MKTLLLSFLISILAIFSFAEKDRILYIDDLRNIGDAEDSQVMVATVPITQYTIDTPAQTNIQTFFDCEIKVTDSDYLSTQQTNVIVNPRLRLLLGSFNMPINMYLDARTNDWYSIYYFDIKSRKVVRLEQEHYDSLLEAILDNLQLNMNYSENKVRPLSDDAVPAAPYFYVCVDGRKIDPRKEWFYEGNHKLEAHALRLYPWGQLEKYKGNAWVPLEVHWFEEVPDFLAIPRVDYTQADSPFWRLFHSSH